MLTKKLLLVYTKTVDSVEGVRWLASKKSPNILCYFTGLLATGEKCYYFFKIQGPYEDSSWELNGLPYFSQYFTLITAWKCNIQMYMFIYFESEKKIM